MNSRPPISSGIKADRCEAYPKSRILQDSCSGKEGCINLTSSQGFTGAVDSCIPLKSKQIDATHIQNAATCKTDKERTDHLELTHTQDSAV